MLKTKDGNCAIIKLYSLIFFLNHNSLDIIFIHLVNKNNIYLYALKRNYDFEKKIFPSIIFINKISFLYVKLP